MLAKLKRYLPQQIQEPLQRDLKAHQFIVVSSVYIPRVHIFCKILIFSDKTSLNRHKNPIKIVCEWLSKSEEKCSVRK